MATGCDYGAVAGHSGSGYFGEPGLLRHISLGESAVEPDASTAGFLRVAYLSASGRTERRADSHRMGRTREEVTLFCGLCESSRSSREIVSRKGRKDSQSAP